MKIGDLLPRERVIVPLPGKTLHDAAEQLIGSFVESGLASDGPALIERLGATPPRNAVNVADRAFIVTLRSDDVREVGAALGVTAEPVSLEADTAATGVVVVVVVGPHHDGARFLQAVSSLDRLLARDDIFDQLAIARSADDVTHVKELLDYDIPGQVTVGDVMARRPRSVWPDATLDEAARAMLANRLTAIPVTTQTGEVVGLLTYRAMLQAVLPGFLRRQSKPNVEEQSVDPREVRVREVMDRSVLCVSEDQTLADVANVLTGKAAGRFPVVRDGVLVGVLNRQDIVRRLFS